MVTTFVYAATSPGLGLSDPFGILSSTYTSNGVATINGNLGYTTLSGAVPTPTVSGFTNVNYAQAGIDQGTALSDLNGQACTFSFAAGAIDLASDTTHGPLGIYTPGIYCVTGAADIGGGGTVTLDGAGTYVFRTSGALTTSANSVVSLINGASACDVFWTPGAATTLGANSSFAGTDIDDAGITVGDVSTWIGRALAFGGTVTTAGITITVPTCPLPPAPPAPVVATAPRQGGHSQAILAAQASAAVTPVVNVAVPEVLGAFTDFIPTVPNTGVGPDYRNMILITLLSLGLIVSGVLTLMPKKRS